MLKGNPQKGMRVLGGVKALVKKKTAVRGVTWLFAGMMAVLVMLLAGCGGGSDNGADDREALKAAFPDEKMNAYAPRILGSQAPDFTLPDLAGREVAFSSFKGKPVVLEFAKTTCPYCVRVQPAVEEAAKRWPEVAFIQVFPSNTREEVETFLAETGAGTPQSVILIGGQATDLREAFGHYPYVPVFLFIDEEGTIVHLQFGSLEPEAFDDALAAAFPHRAEGRN